MQQKPRPKINQQLFLKQITVNTSSKQKKNPLTWKHWEKFATNNSQPWNNLPYPQFWQCLFKCICLSSNSCILLSSAIPLIYPHSNSDYALLLQSHADIKLVLESLNQQYKEYFITPLENSICQNLILTISTISSRDWSLAESTNKFLFFQITQITENLTTYHTPAFFLLLSNF